MANCLHCQRFRAYDKDIAIIRLSTDQYKKIRHKCIKGNPEIREIPINEILRGLCPSFEQLEEPSCQ